MSNRSKKMVVEEREPQFVEMCMDKWKKGCHRGARWDKETFDDFPVCVHWFRQIAAAGIGIMFGILGVTGAMGIVAGFGLIMGFTRTYYTVFIEADELSYGENGLQMEGLLQSFGVFLLLWIMTYTGMEHADGGKAPGV